MQRAIAILCVVLLPGAGTYAVAQPPDAPPFDQTSPQQPQPGPAELMSSDQLSNLVAPIALYPDPLLGQVLAASTYPLEIVQAQQWMQQNPGLRGPQLVDAAKQKPSGWIEYVMKNPTTGKLQNKTAYWEAHDGLIFKAGTYTE